MEKINLTLPKDDVILIIKSLKIAQAKKRLEAKQHFRKNQKEYAEKKITFIHKSTQLTSYIEYLTK